jgi:hypothetical protein
MAETMELQTLRNELTRTDIAPHELQKLAEDKSVEILQKINATTERITEAKQEAEFVKAMKSGWFGKTRKKADATANAVVTTNEALSEMNNLLQESIRFTCSSIQFAQVMHKTMAYMMVNGFKDTNGQITQLSADSREAVQLILDEADDFVTKQLAVEEKQAEMYRRLNEQDRIDEEQNHRLEKLKTIFEDTHEETKKTFDEKNKIDQEQSKRLENLQKLLAEKNQVDEAQEKEIRLLVEYTKQKNILDKEQSENIQEIMDILKIEVAQKRLSLVMSIIALIISISTLAFILLRLLYQW